MATLTKILSGGQTGVDQAALRAARACGLAFGGWCPPGRECETGVIAVEWPLEETPQERSPDAPDVPRSQRTEWNVRDSDGTVILRPSALPVADPGTDWAAQCAARYGRPLLVCDPEDPGSADRIRQWLADRPIRTLNVAGPSERTAPGIEGVAYALLVEVFRPGSRA